MNQLQSLTLCLFVLAGAVSIPYTIIAGYLDNDCDSIHCPSFKEYNNTYRTY